MAPRAPRGAIICSFSGQNDDPSGGGDPSEAGRVQSWGQTKNFMKDAVNEATGGHGAAAITDDMHAFGPGASCNGHDNPLHGGGGGD